MQKRFRVTNIARDEQTGEVLLQVLSDKVPERAKKYRQISRTTIYTSSATFPVHRIQFRQVRLGAKRSAGLFF